MRFKNELVIGFISLVAIVALIMGIRFVKGHNPFTNTNMVYAIYDNVGNLKEGNPMRISGLNVGQVVEVRLMKESGAKVLVGLNLQTDYPIPANSVAKIIDMDFIGSKGVDIILGDSEELLEIGDTLASGYAVGMINKIEDQLSPLSHKVEKLITNFNVTLKSIENASNGVNTLLSENQQSIRESIDNFNNLSLSLKETAQKTNTVLETFNDKMDSLQMMEIAQLVKDFDKLATDISATVEGLNRGEGSLGKLMTDEQLYTNLTRSSKELEDLLRDLKENPKRYVHFSVFGKKDK